MIMRFLMHLTSPGQPIRPIGQSWNQKLGESRLLVPGQLPSASFPNYIKLDTESGELSSHTATETSIPEDGLYYHLVLKVAMD
jgi:hypothetical protein